MSKRQQFLSAKQEVRLCAVDRAIMIHKHNTGNMLTEAVLTTAQSIERYLKTGDAPPSTDEAKTEVPPSTTATEEATE